MAAPPCSLANASWRFSEAARLSPHLPVDALLDAFTASATVARMLEAVLFALDFWAAISSATVW